MRQILNELLNESIFLKQKMCNERKYSEDFETIANLLVKTLHAGNKILICGNGGSAADAQHFSAELVGRYKKERRGLPAIALTCDSSAVTAWSNDYSFESYFSRAVEALGNKGDLLIGISTSGNSKNVLSALSTAKSLGLSTACLLGCDGGAIASVTDCAIIVPSKVTARIQECHILLIHALCERVDLEF